MLVGVGVGVGSGVGVGVGSELVLVSEQESVLVSVLVPHHLRGLSPDPARRRGRVGLTCEINEERFISFGSGVAVDRDNHFIVCLPRGETECAGRAVVIVPRIIRGRTVSSRVVDRHGLAALSR